MALPTARRESNRSPFTRPKSRYSRVGMMRTLSTTRSSSDPQEVLEQAVAHLLALLGMELHPERGAVAHPDHRGEPAGVGRDGHDVALVLARHVEAVHEVEVAFGLHA